MRRRIPHFRGADLLKKAPGIMANFRTGVKRQEIEDCIKYECLDPIDSLRNSGCLVKLCDQVTL